MTRVGFFLCVITGKFHLVASLLHFVCLSMDGNPLYQVREAYWAPDGWYNNASPWGGAWLESASLPGRSVLVPG